MVNSIDFSTVLDQMQASKEKQEYIEYLRKVDAANSKKLENDIKDAQQRQQQQKAFNEVLKQKIINSDKKLRNTAHDFNGPLKSLDKNVGTKIADSDKSIQSDIQCEEGVSVSEAAIKIAMSMLMSNIVDKMHSTQLSLLDTDTAENQDKIGVTTQGYSKILKQFFMDQYQQEQLGMPQMTNKDNIR
ncbi:MAG: hypothetical protein AB8B67_04900 [Rickettsiaceae bacterium]